MTKETNYTKIAKLFLKNAFALCDTVENIYTGLCLWFLAQGS